MSHPNAAGSSVWSSSAASTPDKLPLSMQTDLSIRQPRTDTSSQPRVKSSASRPASAPAAGRNDAAAPAHFTTPQAALDFGQLGGQLGTPAALQGSHWRRVATWASGDSAQVWDMFTDDA